MNRQHRPTLVRSGIVLDAGDGCTSIEVSVPCSTCRLGICRSRTGKRPFTLAAEGSAAELRAGDAVEVSVSRKGLNGVSARLFGPTVFWAALVASTPLMPSEDGLPAGSGAIVTGLGLLAALLIGRRLARSRMRQSGAMLDLKVERSPIE